MSGFEKYSHIEKFRVRLNLGGAAMPMGTLAWSAKEKRSYFEFDKEFIERNLAVSPFKLPLQAGAQPAPDEPFDGLHGVFNDSLPDGWGRWLLDRKLKKRNFNAGDLTALDRLSFVGATGMGALTYEPEDAPGDLEASQIDLDDIAEQAEQAQEDFTEVNIDRLYEMQGSSGGARPKIMIGRDTASGRLIADVGTGLPNGFEPWIVKFRSKANDHAQIGPEEYAYSLMAKSCGVKMPETKLLQGEKGKYFAVSRFDRNAKGRAHVHTVCGLIYASHRYSSIDYTTLFKITRLIARDETHVRQMFRRMVFNVLARNRDDHTKNHAFEMAPDGVWKPTPAYDLTLSAGQNGEHSLAIAGEGANPSFKQVMEEAKLASISKGEAEATFEEVKAAVDRWPSYAEKAELPERRTEEVDYLLNGRGRRPKSEVEVAVAPPSP